MVSVALWLFAGLAALCLAMEKHFVDLLGRKPQRVQVRVLRIVGWALLLSSLVLAVQLRGWAHGLVEWTAALMAGLTLWVFALPYLPRLMLGLATASLLLAPLCRVYGL